MRVEEEECGEEDVEPQYNLLSDNLRRRAPAVLQCSMFCGGRRCKYETPENWDSSHMAIRGIYSHWITDDILAMARPCTEIIMKKNVIRQFQSLGVKSLINLQEPGEHKNCGCPLEPSGFTYEPTTFMDYGIYYYNYSWADYGDVKVTWLLDMVKTMNHTLTEGKVAIHCHAGLGRTGVLISCYLVYSMKFRANDAIKFVRLKRPNSVQSRGQIFCVQAFERYYRHFNVVFSKKLLLKQPRVPEITLPTYILTQKIMLHGYEARCIQHIPKIIYVICERLLELCDCAPVATIPDDHHAPTTLYFFTARQNPSHYHYISSLLNLHPNNSDEEAESENQNEKAESDINIDNEIENEVHFFSPQDVVEAILVDQEDMRDSQRRNIAQYEMILNYNESCWQKLQNERSLVVLTGLLTDWLEQLKTPIIDCELLCQIIIHAETPLKCLQKFDYVSQFTIEYLFRFTAHLEGLNDEEVTCLIQRLIVALTQQSVVIRDTLTPKEKEFNKLRKGTYKKVMEFSMNLLAQVKRHVEWRKQNKRI
ncbi:protein tyrosine phosphatase domain-containing protein 1-like [Macrosteles quadrilineatus]|uniref:protein tyrosine phosphatase domain-containing protein 1-like n=1 Tax=Macrosteles quadrilineatus TaxID=74068 RepID=UPI0023E2A238|nr:protein tyrosine phosphatase domain-containing protein 1-like [Macrosteles quadrilineatus]